MASGSAASGWLGGDWTNEHRARRSRAEREPTSMTLRTEDKDLFTRTRHACDIRVLYEVDDDAATVYIINIGIIS
jgi:mRNA-degrading endonuclease RelE of RelBE toxin-antitoxin system